MKPYFILVLCLCLVFRVSAQKITINNTLTPQHQFVSGTKIAIVPPENFGKGAGFSGFQQTETNSSIIVTTMPAPYAMLEKGFSTESLKSRGMNLLSKEAIMFQGQPAVLYKVTQSAQGTMFAKYIILAGDAKESLLINGIYPEGNEKLDAQIWQAMKTVVYQKDKVIDAMADADFTIDLSGTKIKYATTLAGSYLFSSDGQVPVQAADKAFLTIGRSFSAVNLSDKKQYAIDRLKTLPEGDKTKVDKINPIEVNGMNGYEIVGYGQDAKGNKELIHEVILYFDNSYYLLIGIASNDFDNYLNQFKKISRSFKRKE